MNRTNAPIARAGGLALALACLFAPAAHAAATEQEAAQLGKTLTPVGAERAGNRDGTIPEWTGGVTSAPAGWKVGQKRIDPFAADKPLFSIDASNVDKYKDKLSEGQAALVRQIKGYRELSQQEIDAMNEIKTMGAQIGALVEKLRAQDGLDQRWISIGATDMQKGLMALTRGVAQPTFF